MKKPVSGKFAAASVVLILAAALMTALLYREFRGFLYSRPYADPGSGYVDSFFADSRVLFIVPHEDDDANLAQGVIEQYADAGAEVWVLFATNGDHANPAKIRIDEAVMAEEANGVPADRLIFLGYGNMWDEALSGCSHIYNAPEDRLMTSSAGFTATYGTPAHPDYRSSVSGSPSPYTKRAFIEDLRDCIDELRPDTIYCSDLDEHPDHRAVSLLFESALAEILSRPGNDYFPRVLKGFCYCTAWDGARAYHGSFVPSTPNPSDRRYAYNDKHDDPDCLPHMRAYLWSERLRVPAAPRSLAWSRRSSGAYAALSAYQSQEAIRNFDKILKADKVYWERPTTGLCYNSSLLATSGKAEFLNDFKLYDTSDVMREDTLDNNEGVWIPDSGDGEKTVTITFPAPADLQSIVLYDNDSLSDQILSGVLHFSDGSSVETGALRDNGAATEVWSGEKQGILWFSFTVLETKGNAAGLTELEAYGSENRSESEASFLKTTDPEGNFICNYLYDRNDALDFGVYLSSVPAGSLTYDLSLDGVPLKTGVPEEELSIPNDFRRHLLTISLHGREDLSDTVLLLPRTLRYRVLVPLVQELEKKRDRF